MRLRIVALCIIAASVLPASAGAQDSKPDPWQPVRFMAGEWRGVAEGQAGAGTVERTYVFVIGERYLHEKNVSRYAPADTGEGEVHEHCSFFSYDRGKKALALRQFHEEGFVNCYIMAPDTTGSGKIVFESVEFENFDNRWKARETYDVISPDEFVEAFELAPPGKAYEVYSRNHFTRAK